MPIDRKLGYSTTQGFLMCRKFEASCDPAFPDVYEICSIVQPCISWWA